MDCRLKTKSSTAIQLNLFKQKHFEKNQLSNLRVWYGFTHLTKKVMKKRALQILFENDYHCRNEEKVNRWMHIATVRQQTV
ncbi:MAG: hypothetical protein LBF04_07140, partial [Prevotellaceae bacterium]|nr:hypothetical protein [Prevotellaceae bacterium]